MNVGSNILKYRKKSGLSQDELGQRIDVTRQTISNWETGETIPNIEQLKAIAKALEIDVEDLTGVKFKNEKYSKKTFNIMLGIIITLIIILIGLLLFMFNNEKFGYIKLQKITSNTTTKVTTKNNYIAPSFIRTYKIKSLKIVDCPKDNNLTGCYDFYYHVILENNKGESAELELANINDEFKKLEQGKTYEFKFQSVGEIYYEDKIQNIFGTAKIVSITETAKIGSKQINEKILY